MEFKNPSIFNKKWILKNRNEELIDLLEKNIQLPKTIIQLLTLKGLDSQEKIVNFLNPSVRKLNTPFKFFGMEEVVLRLKKALQDKEKIMVYGDRDVDGITALSIMVYTLRLLGGDVEWYLNRDEGYGVSEKILKEFVKKGVTLVVTVDCGITAIQEVDFLVSQNVDVIVTDHHQPKEKLPNAFAVINPHVRNSLYPFSELAGCGVSFKVMQALMYSFARDFGKKMLFITYNAEREILFKLYKNGVQISEVYKIKGESKTDKDLLASIIEDADELFFVDVVQYEKMRLIFPNIFSTLLKQKVVNYLGERFPVSRYLREEEKEMVSLERLNELYLFEEFIFDLRMRHYLYQTVDLVALGTLADMVPMIDENRILVNLGLKILQKTRNLGLRTLLKQLRLSVDGTSIGSKEVTWKIIPTLNSCGRCQKPEIAVNLLLGEFESEVQGVVNKILEINELRKELQKKNKKYFEECLENEYDSERDKFLFLYAEDLDHGVTGIVANGLLRRFQKPVFLLIKIENEIHGSVRSPQNIAVLPILEKCSRFLSNYGGHQCAAGFRLAPENLSSFRNALTEVFGSDIFPLDISPKINVDAEYFDRQIDWDFLNILDKFEPFGVDNKEPIFLLKKVKIKKIDQLGVNKNHLRINLEFGGKRYVGMGWDFGEVFSAIECEGYYDIVFNIEVDNSKSERSFRLILHDIAVSQEDKVLSASF
ncbi:MAG: single-stranded-DNA-specific exonuclease RecJ [bacterium]